MQLFLPGARGFQERVDELFAGFRVTPPPRDARDQKEDRG
jgi:hypothetical protein